MTPKPSIEATISATDDAAHVAGLHASAFERPWSVDAFAALMRPPRNYAFAAPDGFILLQSLTAQEAEILTLAVRPSARRQGLAAALLAHAVSHLQPDRLFLEVAADNQAARALYRAHGFVESGRRPAYYKNRDGSRTDAVLMHAVFSP